MTALELPSWRATAGDRERVLDLIDNWAASSALAAVMGAFGGSVPESGAVDRLAWLDSFAAAEWDFRHGRERDSIRRSALSPAQSDAVIGQSPELGLANRERPGRAQYDTVIMTGGMVRAGIVKPRFVAELLEQGLGCGHILFLGGFRPFSSEESVVARALEIDADDEFGGMLAGLEQVFGPLGVPELDEHRGETPHASWRHLTWNRPRLPRLSVLAAPSSDPLQRRANSADTYRFWAEQRRTPAEHSVLQVTSPIYVPYQAAVAVGILGLDNGLAVDTVGASASASDLGPHSQPFLAEHHLQELRAAIGAMLALRRRLDG
ncbi:hypothetical protein F1C58_09645 [Glaciihabitans sp. INWT7]|uniref:hypothetical protein n=1 Tax=Glaciihabitans sp. INWT7 TaxID=2596912 RepID=UPI00162541AE|nr:hypothetical protein [Glaciihabitans sp. INWT7]QNE47136.1 hypothetical protein F1C58_09645 [Glaciihabitans sp. INWT7]